MKSVTELQGPLDNGKGENLPAHSHPSSLTRGLWGSQSRIGKTRVLSAIVFKRPAFL